MNGRTKQRQTFSRQDQKQLISFHCRTFLHGPQSVVTYTESGLGHEKWSWNKRFFVCQTDPWSVGFLLPSTLHKGNESFWPPRRVMLVFPRQRNELLTVPYGSVMDAMEVPTTGRYHLFPGFVPVERSCSCVKERVFSVPYRRRYGAASHVSPIRYGYFFPGVPTPVESFLVFLSVLPYEVDAPFRPREIEEPT